MKYVIAVSAIVLASVTAKATALPVKSCQAVTSTHILKFEQVGKDIQVTLEDKALQRYSDLSNPKEGKLKIFGKQKNIVLIEGKNLPDFISLRYLPRELAVGMMMGRPEYIGEEDLLYSYADSFITALSCK
ncbi:MAG: hypothetical protein OM95_12395 [Bdellovibrio sp. ArHS]|uniref:hypothetical protein n=1 Tax=Bdellovibrio sp. ArHS TaxID=1569284 RepID=UPI000583D2DE|nr:hypothetical protein [Bdellovibrio sp. ArHS]KHD87803.1 MAG: hypothetical protein OM95_12395 [Bdellovibrio sp. ArHS]